MKRLFNRRKPCKPFNREHAAERAFISACNCILNGFSFRYMNTHGLNQEDSATIWNFALEQIQLEAR